LTTIVIDRKNRLIASDRQMTYGGFKTLSSPKIRRLVTASDECLVASAGSSEAGTAFDIWFKEKFEGVNSKRPYPRERNFAAVVLYKSGELFLYEQRGYPIEIKGRYFAIGSGSEYALGAVHAGVDLRKAVQISAKLDNGTGFGIQVEGFTHRA
jgi:ATP-dependent protease HslVU (ClpYQ) peptidase subunit